jgi:putative SOS response-associated peptidase YedK
VCGRYVSPGEAAIERFWHLGHGGGKAFGPRYNAAPTQALPVVRARAGGGRELALLRWGLVPSWAKDPAIGARMINARAESLAERAAFRAAFRRRRCLVPMAGFYEWKKAGGRKLPYYVHPLNAELFAAAGLYEFWPGRDGAEPIESYAIITTNANEMMARIHNRMPAILHERDHDAWLDPENARADALARLLGPYPAEEMRAYPVSTRVNNVRNDDEGLIVRESSSVIRDP